MHERAMVVKLEDARPTPNRATRVRDWLSQQAGQGGGTKNESAAPRAVVCPHGLEVIALVAPWQQGLNVRRFGCQRRNQFRPSGAA